VPEQMGSGVDARYETLGELGRGGMGIVYKARDRETGELIAVKVLKPEIAADPSSIERFKSELRLARKITHKNVCRIYDFNRAGDTAYISMELVQGESLRSILNRFGTLSYRKGIEIARQICAGLREAHAEGVIHRDLKPQNIMLDTAGNAKIMDFGIARSMEAGATTTLVVGTPGYMSPEQAEGRAVDQRSDIYTLGLILYEMFTGTPAFAGDTPLAALIKQMREQPAPPHEPDPTIPGWLESAIVKCLERDPTKRFQSVDELQAALDQGLQCPVKLEGAVPASQPPPGPAKPSEGARRRWLALAALVFAVGLLPGFWLIGRRGRPSPRMHHLGAVSCVVFSPDGSLLASGSEDKTVKLWNVASAKEMHTLSGHTRAVLAVAFSPDGRWLASAGVDKTIRIWEVHTGRELQRLSVLSRRVSSLVFTPDGSVLASGGDDGNVTNWDPATGRKLLTFKAHDDAIDEIAVSPDGNLLATASADETVRLWKISTGGAQLTIRGHADELATVAFAPNGRWVASAGYDRVIKIWDVATGQEFRSLQGHEDVVNHVTFSPDGRLLASASDDSTVRIWQVEDGQLVRIIKADGESVSTVAFSPDGRRLASAGGDKAVRLWDAATGKELY
jgi:WD40 repeat protein/serine/threonine protein kinase